MFEHAFCFSMLLSREIMQKIQYSKTCIHVCMYTEHNRANRQPSRVRCTSRPLYIIGLNSDTRPLIVYSITQVMNVYRYIIQFLSHNTSVNTMPAIKLIYFDLRARAEPARLILAQVSLFTIFHQLMLGFKLVVLVFLSLYQLNT